MRSLLFFSFCVSLALTPVSAAAQKGYALGLGGGTAIPVGKLGDVQKTGYSALAFFAVGSPDSPLGLRFDGIYNNLTATKTTGVTAADLRVFGALVDLVYAFPGTSAKPYALVGGGWYGSKVDTTAAIAQNNLGFNAGLGVSFGLGPAAAFIEARYHTISRSEVKGGEFQFVPITLGQMF